MSLQPYLRKRHFGKTPEPERDRPGEGGQRRFVVQKHAASHLHYDFRLEISGALKSWAVPKGIPFAREEKRLAIQVEDHPVSYIAFEGIIPKGQYGGGTVMVWDQGTFEPLSTSPARDLAAGKLHFILKGKKLRGEWRVVRLRDTQWLLIRGKTDMTPVSKKRDDLSALSGRTMSELGGNKEEEIPVQAHPRKTEKLIRSGGAVSGFVEPMKARLADASPKNNDWLYEIKLDGFRAIALKHDASVRLFSRNEKDFGAKFPEVAKAVAELPARDLIIDGEVVALDAEGRSSFQLLQAYDLGEERPPIFFYVFDLLSLNGRNLQDEPLVARKKLLAELLKHSPGPIRNSAPLQGSAATLLQEAKKLGLEGLIGKKKESRYQPGRRTGEWIKLKLHSEQEMVIGGYTDPEGSRNHFGALLLGYHKGPVLRFAGKVGTGFDEALIQKLHVAFERIRQSKCPFANLPEKSNVHSNGLTAREMKRCHWLKPKLVCQVKFSEWTREEKLRQPVFLGLRPDKEAAEVVRERTP